MRLTIAGAFCYSLTAMTSLSPPGFREKVLEIYLNNPELAWVTIGEQALVALNFTGEVNGKALSDRVRGVVSTHKKGDVTVGAAPELAPLVPNVHDSSLVTQVWVKRKRGTYQFTPDKAMSFQQVLSQLEGEIEGVTLIDAIRDIVAGSPLRPYEQMEVKPEREDSLAGILADMHVGLNPNPNRRAMYPVEYNPAVFGGNISKFYNALKFNADYYGPVSLLSVTDLGDCADGFNKLTTRGGHELEQNLDNIGQFQTIVQEKLRLAENLIHSGIAKRYVFNNVTNSNHDGDFAAIINMTVQMILERSYPKEVITFRVMQRPIEHFIYGDHAIVMLHGKDQQYQFKGLPLVLDVKTEKSVRTYIDYNQIKSKYIHVWKGDLHQNAYSRCELFDYRSFCSFAPPSQWVTNNFPGSYSGFAIQRIPKWGNEIQHTDYRLEFERVMPEVSNEEYVY